jgi:CheY-like chemotaxis protein
MSGQTVFSALSGEEGIEMFRNNAVDVVICDYSMPRMDGWQVGKAIRAACEQDGVPKPPFLLLTGWGELGDQTEKVMECGVDRIIQKPASLASLLQIVREVMEESVNMECR